MIFTNRVAVITGGAQGIGAAVVRCLAAGEAKVAIIDLDRDKAEQLACEIREKGGECLVLSGDISKRSQVEEMARVVLDKYKKIDILVNNAGLNRDNLFVKMTEEQWDTVMNVICKGAFNVTQVFTGSMIENKYGRIINISSAAGKIGNLGQVNYSCAKAGIIGFTKALAKELARYNITVNAVQPGYTETAMTAAIPDKIKEQFIKQIPLGRSSSPEEQAGVIAFLASDYSSYMTGTVLEVNGGAVM